MGVGGGVGVGVGVDVGVTVGVGVAVARNGGTVSSKGTLQAGVATISVPRQRQRANFGRRMALLSLEKGVCQSSLDQCARCVII